ncbi:MAG: PDDEXK nuclease domain-containing protein [Verrucomicrobia bacterium]|nr:PDDEXK nuclease domain-containing protein [Verrucomicrobiota bacterium]
MKANSLNSPDYLRFVADLKARIQSARLSAARSVNRDLILLYWDIGRGIVDKQQTAGWGDAVVERLAADLRAAFPDMRGFSVVNLWRMKQLYLDYTAPEFLSQAVRELKIRGTGSKKLSQAVRESGPPSEDTTETEFLAQAVRELVASIPWGHHANLLARLTDPAARLWYLRATAQLGWSRNVLLNQIKAGAYERAVKEKKTHNFTLALPEHLAEQADEMLKSRYNLEFLGIGRAMKERELEDRLIARLQQFILELGYGFCFVGRQYRLALGGKEYFVDLLFYHRFLKALVAFDLKIGSFEPEHAGKMDFYLNLLNEKERAPDDRPSIGIILCAEKDNLEVEFALKTKGNPIGVAEYQLQPKLPAELKGKLPTAKQLADAMKGEMGRMKDEL